MSEPGDEVMTETTMNLGAELLRFLIDRLGPRDGAPAGLLDEQQMLDALMFAAAVLVEANPNVATIEDMQMACSVEARNLYGMVRAGRELFEQPGIRFLAQLGGVTVAVPERLD